VVDLDDVTLGDVAKLDGLIVADAVLHVRRHIDKSAGSMIELSVNEGSICKGVGGGRPPEPAG
jgi:hypothetical protein